MGLFDQFVYTNFHEMNLDWLLNEVKNFKADYNEITKYIIMPVEDPAALSVSLNNRLRGVDFNSIFEALGTDGWTDMPTGASSGCFINIIYTRRERTIGITGDEPFIEYKAIQLFVNNAAGSLGIYFRTVSRTYDTTAVSLWQQITSSQIV